MSYPTAEELKSYEENGYLKIGRILSDEELEIVRAAGERTIAEQSGELIMEEGTDTPVIKRVSKLVERDKAFMGAATHPKVLKYLKVLLGTPQIELCTNRHNMLIVKQAFYGSEFPWHQDAGSWMCNKFITLMVLLDDATIDNGCLQVIPGIHRHPDYQNPEPGWMDLSVEMNQKMLTYPKVHIECKAGEGYFFGALTPHHSPPNTSPNDRRSLNFAYIATKYHQEAEAKKGVLESIPFNCDNPSSSISII